MAEKRYNVHAKKASEDLMRFISGLFPGENPPCVTYFDEAHELDTNFWCLLRLLQSQAPSMKMWYVFMGTKSSISYYAPSPEKSEFNPSLYSEYMRLIKVQGFSLKLRHELRRLVPPYISLDFDLHAMQGDRTAVDVEMHQFETMEHLTRYGRPM